MKFLYPKMPRRKLQTVLAGAGMGLLVGGLYGIFHDLFTYSISSEYFTHAKFHQFDWANMGLPPRLFAAEIGFIATGAFGFLCGYFLCRFALPEEPPHQSFPKIITGFSIILLFAFIAGVIGYLLGARHTDDYSNWQDLCQSLGITDIPAFVHVAYIHNAGYIGGLTGLVLGIVILRLWQRKTESEQAIAP
ncbi:MAG: hypothetical protein AAF571_13665 [Verrucomicrobiota bacterium]